ncbi:MAG: AAA family ATPase [Dehalococcoidia bacterium]
MSSGNESPPPALIILSGLPGSGKTTFARTLVNTVPAVHVESDAVRRALAPAPRYTQSENRRVFDEVERLADAALASGRIALVDATNLRHDDRLRFHSLAARSRVPLIGIRVIAPPRVIRARLAAPRRGHSQAGLDVFERMRGRAQRFLDPSIVVDTRYSLDPSLRLLARLLKESKLWTPPVP